MLFFLPRSKYIFLGAGLKITSKDSLFAVFQRQPMLFGNNSGGCEE